MEPINDIDSLVARVEVTDAILEKCRAKGQFGALLFDLYKESGGLVCVASAADIGHHGDALRLERNQAIAAGLLVRISKLMASVVKLSSDIEHGETVQALNRCIIESVVNVRYLLLKDSDEVYNRFVKNGLRPEREFYDIIHQEIEQRGGQRLTIEVGMLKSITDKCKASGVTIEEVDLKAGSWGGSLRDRVETLESGKGAYTILQRIPSHAIHGTWMDLLSNHLLPQEDRFDLNFDHLQTDGELLTPIAFFAIEAAREYLDKYIGRRIGKQLYERVDDVHARLMKVETTREDWQVVDHNDLL